MIYDRRESGAGRLSILAILLSLLVGCETVVDIELEEGPKRLVVDGGIEAVAGDDGSYQAIKLSTTTDFNASDPAPVRDAAVTVRDDQGRSFDFVESPTVAGTYEATDFIVERNGDYALTVIYEGETYQASETMASVPPIDSVYQRFFEANAFEEAGTHVLIDYTDPADETNYYVWEHFRNGERLIDLEAPLESISKDEFYNGQQIIGKRFSTEEESDYDPGDLVTVRQLGISAANYSYLLLFAQQSESTGPFGTPAAPVRGNVRNLTTPENYPLGYFHASEVAEVSITIADANALP